MNQDDPTAQPQDDFFHTQARLQADLENAKQAASLAQEQQREAAPRVQQAHLEQAKGTTGFLICSA